MTGSPPPSRNVIVIDAALPLGAVVEAALTAIGPIVGPGVVEGCDD